MKKVIYILLGFVTLYLLCNIIYCYIYYDVKIHDIIEFLLDFILFICFTIDLKKKKSSRIV